MKKRLWLSASQTSVAQQSAKN